MTQDTKFWTWAQIKAKVESELDLEDEDFVDETEAMQYANDAVNRAEALIHSIYEDYFLTRDEITLVDGTDTYSLPTNIYGHKIRGVVYYSGSTVYEVKRIRDYKKFLEYRLQRTNTTNTEDYQYFIYNDTSGTPQVLFTPPAYEDGQVVEIWYLRQANRFESGTDECDIPEFVAYVFDWIRERVAFKVNPGGPAHMAAKANLDETEAVMIDTLTTMVPDTDNEIEPDTRFYDEMN